MMVISDINSCLDLNYLKQYYDALVENNQIKSYQIMIHNNGPPTVKIELFQPLSYVHCVINKGNII